VLGFVKKHDVPLGDASWLTVVSSEPWTGRTAADPDGHRGEAVQDSVGHGREFGRLLRPWTTSRWSSNGCGIGVKFTQEPLAMGEVTPRVFRRHVRNLIQIVPHRVERWLQFVFVTE